MERDGGISGVRVWFSSSIEDFLDPLTGTFFGGDSVKYGDRWSLSPWEEHWRVEYIPANGRVFACRNNPGGPPGYPVMLLATVLANECHACGAERHPENIDDLLEGWENHIAEADSLLWLRRELWTRGKLQRE